MRRMVLCFLCLGITGCSGILANPHAGSRRPTSRYPRHWWEPVPDDQAASWEILPQEARPGEVILSKRNELGLLSNFAETPFVVHGKRYRSVEGFWQMMKYPDDPSDPRATFLDVNWKFRREQVAQMVGLEAKTAGDLASETMKKMGIDWVSFEGRRMKYRTPEKGAHYDLIVEATWAKIRQNPQVRQVLRSTGDLILRPDHHQSPDAPPAWRYHQILMLIRTGLPSGDGERGSSAVHRCLLSAALTRGMCDETIE